MKKISLFCTVWALGLAALPSTLHADILFGVAAESYPPFTFKDASGSWVGWEVDFMKSLCAKLNEKCSIVDVAWEGIIPALNAKKFDVILASMAVTEKRKAAIDFSDVYYKSTPQLISVKGMTPYHQPSDLAGKRVGVQGSSIHQSYAEKYFVNAGAVIKVYAKQDNVFSDLAAGRLDYAMADALALDAFLKSAEGGCCVIAGAVAFDPEIFGVGVGLGLRKGDQALEMRLNGAIKAVGDEGGLIEITNTWHLTDKINVASPQ